MADESTDIIRYTTAADGRKLALVSYDIVYEAVEDHESPIPPGLEAGWEALHAQVTSAPAAAIGQLEGLVDQYPQVPVLMNWLAAAYSAADRRADADAVTDRLCREHPNYLFGRIQRAQRCLYEGHPERVREALGGELDLKMMYPDRTRFHVTEVAALWGLLGEWRLVEKDVDGAQVYMDLLKRLAPDHPVTRKLSILMLPHVLKRGFEKLGGFGRGRQAKRREAPAKPVEHEADVPTLFSVPGARAADRSSGPRSAAGEPEPVARVFRHGSHTPRKDRNRKGRRR